MKMNMKDYLTFRKEKYQHPTAVPISLVLM